MYGDIEFLQPLHKSTKIDQDPENFYNVDGPYRC